mmetsp:Transcript_32758/g.76171  ORF Transcript_32758/g.76171 Transcript_32758/m.76171 type:complete len:352 (-) Transcript_32758:64-1119(-)|eukprot:CAMPEP_0171065838 /NCGR_PEP_ID=MMETSP0766_2-20121228/7076_1 /TAXON_ID=439317 /ORGANISM="Gambierdiscus australes, Strain CAWD 149" /LENGTH=351 /DNA_ID=CAMNT_0011521973 /DNA_START=51 /DNA_END=1106 /DNA_ORIENTATION=-
MAKNGAGAPLHEADEFSLAHTFYDAYIACNRLTRGDGSSMEQEELDSIVSKLKAIASRVVQLRLFSPNEELDDVSTADLKFLLVPYLLAEATAATREMSQRLSALRQAIIYWKAFGHDCERLQLAHADDVRAFDRKPDDTFDPQTKRDEKIARYKRSKELDEKVAYLFAKKRQVLGDEFQWGAGSSFDEDMERDLVLSLLRRACAAVAESIASAEQELPLLEMMIARGGPSAAPPQEPVASEKPFILRIQDKAELMRIYKEMVFQCPYELPTVTLAEAADHEMEQMRRRQELQGGHERRMKAMEDERWYSGDRYGSKEEEELEEKTYKDRDWDDWKDEHPWGSGNKGGNLG